LTFSAALKLLADLDGAELASAIGLLSAALAAKTRGIGSVRKQ
jgi:hypothetical protein